MNDIDYLKKYYQGNIDDAIKRLNNGEPVQYIVGNVNFYGYLYEVNKNVLIPRFETEELVYNTLQILKKHFPNGSILDMCSGSGCIGLTLKQEMPSLSITLSDISHKAIEVSRINRDKYALDCQIILSDLFQNIKGKYDCLIANPPYIAYDEKIMDIVKNNEPAIALYAEKNGLDIYERIFRECLNFLNDRFLVALELNSNKSKEILSLAKLYIKNASMVIKKDNYGRDRMLFITKNIE